jgi:hypothetical protein
MSYSNTYYSGEELFNVLLKRTLCNIILRIKMTIKEHQNGNVQHPLNTNHFKVTYVGIQEDCIHHL